DGRFGERLEGNPEPSAYQEAVVSNAETILAWVSFRSTYELPLNHCYVGRHTINYTFSEIDERVGTLPSMGIHLHRDAKQNSDCGVAGARTFSLNQRFTYVINRGAIKLALSVLLPAFEFSARDHSFKTQSQLTIPYRRYPSPLQ